jgi:hypothetical protein
MMWRLCLVNRSFPEPENNLGHLRLNFSHIDPARLDEGFKRLAAVVREAQLAKKRPEKQIDRLEGRFVSVWVLLVICAGHIAEQAGSHS